MVDSDRKVMEALLRGQMRNQEAIVELGTVTSETTVWVVAVTSKDAPPSLQKAVVMDRNAELGRVLVECGPGFSEFPSDYPCVVWASQPREEEPPCYY